MLGTGVLDNESVYMSKISNLDHYCYPILTNQMAENIFNCESYWELKYIFK